MAYCALIHQLSGSQMTVFLLSVINEQIIERIHSILVFMKLLNHNLN